MPFPSRSTITFIPSAATWSAMPCAPIWWSAWSTGVGPACTGGPTATRSPGRSCRPGPCRCRETGRLTCKSRRPRRTPYAARCSAAARSARTPGKQRPPSAWACSTPSARPAPQVADPTRGCPALKTSCVAASPFCPQGSTGQPTFSVHLGKNVFQCFDAACAAQGNVLDLWAAIHRLPIYDAALHMASTFHLAVNREEEPVTWEAVKNRGKVYLT